MRNEKCALTALEASLRILQSAQSAAFLISTFQLLNYSTSFPLYPSLQPYFTTYFSLNIISNSIPPTMADILTQLQTCLDQVSPSIAKAYQNLN